MSDDNPITYDELVALFAAIKPQYRDEPIPLDEWVKGPAPDSPAGRLTAQIVDALHTRRTQG